MAIDAVPPGEPRAPGGTAFFRSSYRTQSMADLVRRELLASFTPSDQPANWSVPLLNGDDTLHVRMKLAEVLVGASCVERLGVGLALIEGTGLEDITVLACGCMRR